MEEMKKKERQIVTWTQQEDDILREQISLHGTENWTKIASKFKDKTTRQCRRRWYTYLNSDFKKGGWSPEEDILLCEAQKIFGNRWTEIAKVVSGRTDNAVKNRFSTLCKKRAKYKALAKENSISCVNSNNKRVPFPEITTPIKRLRRRGMSENITENCNPGERSHKMLRAPFAVLIQNFNNNVNNLPDENNQVDSANNIILNNDERNKVQGTFLKKDDPKISALMQQAELLSSLAQKVNAEKTEQSLEIAWKVVQDFLKQSKEKDNYRSQVQDHVDLQLEDIKDLIEDLRSSNDGYYLSPECSTGSSLQGEIGSHSRTEYSTSPKQVTPLFRSMAAGIPSPQFSESERSFLLKTLGVESPSSRPCSGHSQPPPHCKRSLLQSL